MEQEFVDDFDSLIGWSFAPDDDAVESFQTGLSALPDLDLFEHDDMLGESAEKADNLEKTWVPTDNACWGEHLKRLSPDDDALACDHAFVRGSGHLKNKFCQHCRAGFFDVPVTHCRAVTPALEQVLYNNNSTKGFWTILPEKMGETCYRTINNAKSCLGPAVLVFDKPVAAKLGWAPLPKEWLSEDGTAMRVIVARGSIVPHASMHAQTKRKLPRERMRPPAKRQVSRAGASADPLSSASSASTTTASICGEVKQEIDDADLRMHFDVALDIPPSSYALAARPELSPTVSLSRQVVTANLVQPMASYQPPSRTPPSISSVVRSPTPPAVFEAVTPEEYPLHDLLMQAVSHQPPPSTPPSIPPVVRAPTPPAVFEAVTPEEYPLMQAVSHQPPPSTLPSIPPVVRAPTPPAVFEAVTPVAHPPMELHAAPMQSGHYPQQFFLLQHGGSGRSFSTRLLEPFPQRR